MPNAQAFEVTEFAGLNEEVLAEEFPDKHMPVPSAKPSKPNINNLISLTSILNPLTPSSKVIIGS